jgi:beta-lactamase regulating signal transducer with metallopeptidase domain
VTADLLKLALAWHAGIVLVLMMRMPWGLAFGARAAYALWLLPLVMLIAVVIGATAPPTSAITVAFDARAAEVLISDAANNSAVRPLMLAWATGALLIMGIGLVRVYRISRQIRPDQERRGGLAVARADFGPALFGLIRPRLILPNDFEQRYTEGERALAIAHEHAHWRRHDIPVRLLSATVATLQWCSPLAWWAHRKLVEDQELACDADVLKANPADRARYARLIVAHGTPGARASSLCTFHTHPLLRRVAMIAHRHQPAVLRWSGLAYGLVLASVATVGVAGSGALQASAPDYRVDMTVTIGDSNAPRAFSVTLGARTGESVAAREDDGAGITEVSLVAEPDPHREGVVTVALQIDANGQRIGAPTVMTQFDEPAQVSVTRADGSSVYTVDLRVRRWDPGTDGK